MQKGLLALKEQKARMNRLIQLLLVPNGENGEKHLLQKR